MPLAGITIMETPFPDMLTEIRQCGRSKDLQKGKWIRSKLVLHKHMQEQVYIANALITMFSRCGSMGDARDVFDMMQNQDVVSWTSLIMGYVENRQSFTALEVFSSMTCKPNHVTFIAAFKACTGLASDSNLDKEIPLQKAMAVHKKAREYGFDRERTVANTMIDMYSKCGNMTYARHIFDRMETKDVISWTALISGYVDKGDNETALELFESMDCQPNRVTFVAALRACSNHDREACLTKGVAVHDRARVFGFEKDLTVANTLVNMYSKCANMTAARRVFEGIRQRDVVSWNVLVLGYVENGQSEVALQRFKAMDCSPDRVTFVGALKACVGLLTESKLPKDSCMKECISIHQLARKKGLDKDTVVANTLINVYSKCESMKHARRVFDQLKHRTVVSWSALLIGYVENSHYLVALELFRCMDCAPNHVTFVAGLRACSGLAAENKTDKETCLRNGILLHQQARELGFDKDVSVANTLMDMYTKCGDMVEAYAVFLEMKYPDVVSWNILILGYVENYQSSLALSQFNDMSCSPNHVTYVAALRACGCLGSLDRGQVTHSDVCRRGLEEDEMVATCLVDLYAKCGKMSLAEEAFNGMSSPNPVSWTTLLGGYSLLGDTDRVFCLAKTMEEAGVHFDSVLMQMILTACSHSGRIDEGERYFKTMSKHGVHATMEHFTCMVDMLGRANRLDEALELMRGMPFVADSVVWTTLLAACKKWSNVEVGKVAFDALVELNEDKDSVAVAHVLMKSIYEKLGLNMIKTDK